jgi:hypothetical protein
MTILFLPGAARRAVMQVAASTAGLTESRTNATVHRERLLIMGTTSMAWLSCHEPAPRGAIASPFGGGAREMGKAFAVNGLRAMPPATTGATTRGQGRILEFDPGSRTDSAIGPGERPLAARKVAFAAWDDSVFDCGGRFGSQPASR